MATSTEFIFFPKLPVELRRNIWELVPQPKRVLGQLPCSKCWKSRHGRENMRDAHPSSHEHSKTSWHLRFVGNNKDEAIFPLLHACHESRAIWLPRYFSPPRFMHINEQQEQEDMAHQQDQSLGENSEVYTLRFDVPFVSYEADIFTVFDAGLSFLGFEVDPFLGFDRQRIQNAAIMENPWSMVEAMLAVAFRRLPALKNLSILILGIDPNLDRDAVSGWQEMTAVDTQHVDADVYDLSYQLVMRHPLFGQSRLRNKVYQADPLIRNDLINYSKLFTAWQWHAIRCDERVAQIPTVDQWWDFYSFMFEGDITECPLEDVPGWCSGNHHKDDILNWSSCSFRVDFKFLVERRCMADLISSSALVLDPTAKYERFTEFKNQRIADFNMRNGAN